MSVGYPPNRSAIPVFALQYAKWLYLSGAAAEVGPDATAVILAVVTLEDEFRYSRAPNFFNRQLMERCGIASEHAFIRARQRAISAGLLHYTPGRKRNPGKYFADGFTAESAAKPRKALQIDCGKRSESKVIPRPSSPSPNPNTYKRTSSKAEARRAGR